MQAAALYNDFNTLAGLRTEARRDADASLREVASQFESLFVQMMLKAMRDATIDGGLFDSHQLDSYEQMYDQQLALEMSNNGGIGLARVLMEQLGRAPGAAGPAQEGEAVLPVDKTSAGDLPLEAYRGRVLSALHTAPQAHAPARGSTGVTGATTIPDEADRDAAASRSTPHLPEYGKAAQTEHEQHTRVDLESVRSPEDFIRAFRPLAQRAAERLGVQPEVLLAQAALETGWGQHVTQGRLGPSNNLFNIKAGADWTGARVAVATLEYRDGVAVREHAEFRAYDSVEGAFDDYADFIESNPRYRKALDGAADGERYLRELQDAGYATDPAYADKILSIMDRAEQLAAR